MKFQFAFVTAALKPNRRLRNSFNEIQMTISHKTTPQYHNKTSSGKYLINFKKIESFQQKREIDCYHLKDQLRFIGGNKFGLMNKIYSKKAIAKFHLFRVTYTHTFT